MTEVTTGHQVTSTSSPADALPEVANAEPCCAIIQQQSQQKMRCFATWCCFDNKPRNLLSQHSACPSLLQMVHVTQAGNAAAQQ